MLLENKTNHEGQHERINVYAQTHLQDIGFMCCDVPNYNLVWRYMENIENRKLSWYRASSKVTRVKMATDPHLLLRLVMRIHTHMCTEPKYISFWR
jgi:hypothetical protein